MRPAPPMGDLALTARLASVDTFAPFGRLLGLGDRARLDAVLATIDQGRPGPRRFTHLQRYPLAQRLLLPLGDVPLLTIVLGPGDPPAGPPAAFRTVPGQGLLIGAGIWHAGPVALAEGVVCELLETQGPVDRLDRRPLADLIGLEAIRVQLPEEPGAASLELDLEAPGAVLVEEGLVGRVVVGLLLLEDLDVPREEPDLELELGRVGEAFRRIRGEHRDIGGLFGVGAMRRLWRDMGLDPTLSPPPYEDRVREALAETESERPDALSGAVRLCSLRRQIAMGVHDAGSISVPLQLRHGREGETLDDGAGRSVNVQGAPLLCDRDGPFAGPVGDVRRVRAGPGASRALVLVYLPAGTEEGDVLAHLEEASRTIRAYAGGREAGRLVI